jgi:RES domain-containing protein
MAITIYRVCRRQWARLDGQGARKVGGRWNSPGNSVVYMAQSVALAILENLVHMSRQDYPTGYVVITANIPDHVRVLDHANVLFADPDKPDQTVKLGDLWVQSQASAVLRVPSAVVIGESNYLINPNHLDFAQIEVNPPAPLNFDPRLFELPPVR